MKNTLKNRVLSTLDKLENFIPIRENLEKAERLNDLYEEIKPDPLNYSIEQAIGLPSQDKEQV